MGKKKNGTASYKVVCAVVFILFCFFYLYFYQTDVLAVAQHVASGGKTRYEPVLGTVLIVLALKFLQAGVQAVARLQRIFFALCYFPSFLILAVITDIPSDISSEIDFGAWAWAFPLIIVIWLFAVYLARQYQPVEVNAREDGFLSQVLGINLSLMLVMMLAACGIGNHNRLFHQRMHVEALISRGEYAEAQKSAEMYLSDDKHGSLLRVYALERQHKLGSELFSNNLHELNSINPYKTTIYTVIIPKCDITCAYRRDPDWQLCELLVRRDLDSFFGKLMTFYGFAGAAVNDSDSVVVKPKITVKKKSKGESPQDSIMRVRLAKLPVHYQEALVVYADKHKEFNRNLIAKDLLEKYEDFKAIESKARRQRVKGSYWDYYFF